MGSDAEGHHSFPSKDLGQADAVADEPGRFRPRAVGGRCTAGTTPYSVLMTGEAAPPDGPGEVAAPDGLRASHQDRDRVVELLRVAAGDGRLTVDELDQRLEQALTARTLGELAVLSADLPAGPAAGAGGQGPVPRDTIRIDRRSANAKRDGRWLVPRRIEVRVASGHVTLDFTEAIITQPSLQIDADVSSGTLTLLTRPGVVVDADDMAVRSGSVKIRAPRDLDVPVVLRIEVSGTIGSGQLRARPRRQTFWQWLRRRSSA